MFYTQPNLVRINPEDLKNKPQTYVNLSDDFTTLNELSIIQKTFIISEPGYGKTRLLKENLINGKEGIFIDLKNVGKTDISEFILKNNFKIFEKHNYQDCITNWKLFKTPNFNLDNNRHTTIYLDALDEVRSDDFNFVIDNIKEFIKVYDKARYKISCRRHYLYKWLDLFSDINFEYVEIYPFNDLQVKDYLINHEIKKDEAEKLFSKFKMQNRLNILQTPRYLEMFVDLINKQGVDNTLNLSICELFERFIYQKLDIESSKKGSKNNKNELIKRVLEKLALIMEIYQSNQITKDELMDFFDDVKSNLSISFLHQVPIEEFYERSLIKDNIETIEFENTEFQEYLASKEIFRLGRTDQIVFDLAVIKELQEIHPSWLPTLSFLIQNNISLLKTIIEYCMAKPEMMQNEEFLTFLPDEYASRKLPNDDRKYIFDKIFSYFQMTGHWIDFDFKLAEKLSYFFDQTSYDSIEKYLSIKNKGVNDDIRNVIKTNTITLVISLLNRNILTESQKKIWRARLIKYINSENQNEIVLRRSIEALGRYNDILIFKKISKKLFVNKDEMIISTLIDVLCDLDPNHEISIDCFIEAIKRENINVHYALNIVSEKKAIKKILNGFKDDQVLRQKYIKKESIYSDKASQFLSNIKRVLDEEISEILKTIIINAISDDSFYDIAKSNFINEIAFMVSNYNNEFIFELLKKST